MPVDKRMDISIRLVKVESQQIGREHTASGDSNNKVEIAGKDTQSPEYNLIQIGDIPVIHIIVLY
jgi:hypothetical protein